MLHQAQAAGAHSLLLSAAFEQFQAVCVAESASRGVRKHQELKAEDSSTNQGRFAAASPKSCAEILLCICVSSQEVAASWQSHSTWVLSLQILGEKWAEHRDWEVITKFLHLIKLQLIINWPLLWAADASTNPSWKA